MLTPLKGTFERECWGDLISHGSEAFLHAIAVAPARYAISSRGNEIGLTVDGGPPFATLPPIPRELVSRPGIEESG